MRKKNIIGALLFQLLGNPIIQAMQSVSTRYPHEEWSSFHSVARNGNLDYLTFLLKNCKNEINGTANDGATPLLIATLYGQDQAVQKLLAADADVTVARNDGATPLFIAAWKGHAKLVEKLLTSDRIDVNQPVNTGRTPLFEAAHYNRTDVISLLLDDPRTDVNKADAHGWSPLLIAAYKGHAQTVKLLLNDTRTDVNAATNRGITALISAAQNGHTHLVSSLIVGGALINKADSMGRTALLAACEQGWLDVVRVLLWAGAQLDTHTLPSYTFAYKVTLSTDTGQIQVTKDTTGSLRDRWTPLLCTTTLNSQLRRRIEKTEQTNPHIETFISKLKSYDDIEQLLSISLNLKPHLPHASSVSAGISKRPNMKESGRRITEQTEKRNSKATGLSKPLAKRMRAEDE